MTKSIRSVEGKVGILGANGYVGSTLTKHFLSDDSQFREANTLLLEGRPSSEEEVQELVRQFASNGGRFILNAAHLGTPRGIQVLDPKGEEYAKCFTTNVRLPEWLAIASRTHGVDLIHLSTLAFLNYQEVSTYSRPGIDEAEGWEAPDDFPWERNWYAGMKYQAERHLISFDETGPRRRVLLARIHLPFSAEKNEKNLLMKMQQFNSFVTDKQSMTSLKGLGPQLEAAMDHHLHGVLHCICDGSISHLEIAQKMQEHGLIDPSKELRGISLQEINDTNPSAPYQARVVARSQVRSSFPVSHQGDIAEQIKTAVLSLAAV